MVDIDDVCVVTQPVSDASESHVRDLLDIINAITTVSLLTANLSDESSLRKDYEVINIATTGTGTPILVAAARFLRNQLRMGYVLWQREERIVLFFGSTSYLIPILAAKLSGKIVVLEPRGDVPLTLRLHWEQRLPTLIVRVLAGSVWCLEEVGYRLSDAIITYTPSMAEELGLVRFESKLHPNGARYVDTEQFYPRISFTERDQVVGFVGRLDEEKRIRELATVAKALPDEITFVFAGDGELRDWLNLELADEIESGSVELTGWVNHDNVPKTLSQFQLLILPSEPTEGLPTVIIESLACGTPVLATPVSGVQDVVQKNKTGFLIRSTNPNKISEDVKKILEREDLEEISKNGRKLIKTEYSFVNAVDRYRTIFEQIINVD